MMKIKVAGKTLECSIDEKGIFRAQHDGETYEHKTLDGLKDALNRQLKKKPLNIPVVSVSGHYRDEELDLRTGILIGKHSGNGNLLVKWKGDDRTEQVSHWAKILRGNVDLQKLKALHKAKQTAATKYEEFVEVNQFDPSKLE